MNNKVYLVEDDENINELVIYALKANGFNATGFDEYGSFKKELYKDIPNLVILDVMLPNVSGIEILKKLKSNPEYQNIKVIMLTAKNSEIDKLKGFEYGADDYVTKPFSVLELIARVKAILKRGNVKVEKKELVIDNISLSAAKREVSVDGKLIELTQKEFKLLEFLMENKGFVSTRESLMTHIWGFAYEAETRTVDIHITALRKKLGVAGNKIKTVRGVGYKIED